MTNLLTLLVRLEREAHETADVQFMPDGDWERSRYTVYHHEHGAIFGYHSTYSVAPSYQDAELYVAFRNNLPTLLRALATMQAVDEAHGEWPITLLQERAAEILKEASNAS